MSDPLSPEQRADQFIDKLWDHAAIDEDDMDFVKTAVILLVQDVEQATQMSGMSLLAKLASVVVHAEEMTGPDGHDFDKAALKSVLDDAEVQAWMSGMAELGLCPVRR